MRVKGFAIATTVAFMCIGILMNCSENTTEVLDESPPPRVPHMPYNESNPYDSTGIYHNIFVENASQYFDEGDTTEVTRFEAMMNAIDAQADSLGWSVPQTTAFKDEIGNMANNWGDSAWVYSYMANFDSELCTETELDYIHQINEAIVSADDSTELMNSLLSIESQIVTENWGANERAALYGISIAKHSAYYWTTVASLNGGCTSCDMFCADEDFAVFMALMYGSESCGDEETCRHQAADWSIFMMKVCVCFSSPLFTW